VVKRLGGLGNMTEKQDKIEAGHTEDKKG